MHITLCKQILTATAFGLLASLPVQASMVEYVMGVSNKEGFASQEMARLSISQVGADTVWRLSANWNQALDAGQPFIMGLDFRLTQGSISQSSLPLFNVQGEIGVSSFNTRGVFFETANTSARFTNGEAASWILHNTRLNDFLIQDVHVNAVYNGQSVKFAPSAIVPEPSSYAMLLSGLAVWSLFFRRGRQENLGKPAARTLLPQWLRMLAPGLPTADNRAFN